MDAFGEIFGYEKEKRELKELADMAKNAEKYRAVGARMPKGVLLYGEPGVGKTLMATAAAKETGRPVFLLRREGDTENFLASLQKTFLKAKESAPSVIILDDMDKYAMTSDAEYGRDYGEYVAVQSELDSLGEAEVLVIATANSIDAFPDSLLRPGRFDRVTEIRLPTVEESRDIIGRYLEGKRVAADVDPAKLAWILEGRSAAVLEGVLNRAATLAGYEDKKEIGMDYLVEACMCVAYNTDPYDEAGDSVDTDAENPLAAVALHEAGHAVAAAVLKPGDVRFAALRRSFSSGGMVVTRPDPDLEDEYEIEIEVSLAGRAAVEMKYGYADTGAARDLEGAARAALKRVARDCAYGARFFREGGRHADTSYFRDDAITGKVTELLETTYEKAKELLRTRWDAVEKIAKRLSEKGVVLGDEVERICGV